MYSGRLYPRPVVVSREIQTNERLVKGARTAPCSGWGNERGFFFADLLSASLD